jgi:hypothetical protein
MPRPEALLDRAGEALSSALASGMTRRSFLGRTAAALMAATGGSAVAAAVKPDEAEAFHFCGHIWTTGSCPSPYRLPRIDRRGYPLRPRDGRPIDNLGRLVDSQGYPVDESGQRLIGADGQPLPLAPRTRLCEEWVTEQFGLNVVTQGAWYRCCNGQVRKLVDCCTTSLQRINGDKALKGYCFRGRRVFCVMYYDTGLPC